jgi:hypothetical protein
MRSQEHFNRYNDYPQVVYIPRSSSFTQEDGFLNPSLLFGPPTLCSGCPDEAIRRIPATYQPSFFKMDCPHLDGK